MIEFPKVSVIIPLYNRVDLIGQTIDSVINQTYENWEAIVVDDGSTDGSFEYVHSLNHKEPRIKVFKRDRAPKGASTCRNLGIERSSGEYMVFLDSDDLLASHCLQQRVQFFQDHQACDFLVFPIQYFEKTVGDRQDVFFRFFYKDYLTSFLLQSHWITMSPIWKKMSLIKLNGFDEELACMQDSDLHLRALIKGMKFKIFRNKALIDGYLRVSDRYDRISNNISVKKLDSKVYTNEKIYLLLAEKNLLTPMRVRMLAANFLNISWNYQLISEKEKADRLWNKIYKEKMTSKRTFFIGKSFIQVRSSLLLRRSRILTGVTKRLYQLFLPKFLLYL